MNYCSLPIGNNSPSNINVVIEISKDTNTKYEYDSDLNVFVLNRCLISSMRYPVNYGFVPQTIADDKDPLDILVYSTSTIVTGTLIKNCRVIGGLNMEDQGQKDYKLIVVPEYDNKNINDIHHVPDEFLNITKDFFKNYKNLIGKNVTVKGWFGKRKAQKIVTTSHNNWLDEQDKLTDHTPNEFAL